MKYFTKELWEQFNSENEEIRRRAESLWIENDKKYALYFEKIKKHIPIDFSKNSFHDSFIKSFRITDTEDKSFSCLIELSTNKENRIIEFYDVEDFSIIFENISCMPNEQLSWGYEEWEIIPQTGDFHEKYRISVLCNFAIEFSFIFKRVVMR